MSNRAPCIVPSPGWPRRCRNSGTVLSTAGARDRSTSLHALPPDRIGTGRTPSLGISSCAAAPSTHQQHGNEKPTNHRHPSVWTADRTRLILLEERYSARRVNRPALRASGLSAITHGGLCRLICRRGAGIVGAGRCELRHHCCRALLVINKFNLASSTSALLAVLDRLASRSALGEFTLRRTTLHSFDRPRERAPSRDPLARRARRSWSRNRGARATALSTRNRSTALDALAADRIHARRTSPLGMSSGEGQVNQRQKCDAQKANIHKTITPPTLAPHGLTILAPTPRFAREKPCQIV